MSGIVWPPSARGPALPEKAKKKPPRWSNQEIGRRMGLVLDALDGLGTDVEVAFLAELLKSRRAALRDERWRDAKPSRWLDAP